MAQVQVAPNLPTLPNGSIRKVADKLKMNYQTARRRLQAGDRTAWDAAFEVLREQEENAAQIRAKDAQIRAEIEEKYRYN